MLIKKIDPYSKPAEVALATESRSAMHMWAHFLIGTLIAYIIWD
jgi:hypothetical protein